ncbi:hypothetical protein Q7P37_003696 [Cladosporium fusiforme]
MPLLLLSGYPKSGKTHRSQQLIEDFSQRIAASSEPRIKRLKLHHVNDDTLALDRNVYATARAEKDARATFSSAVKRALDRDTIVVADGMNYIKGFRYQLYCEAKAVQTPNCVVQIGTQPDKCREFNEAARSNKDATSEHSPPYEPAVFDNLIFRYEEPNGMSRWDAPLFAVPFEDAKPDCDAIWEVLVGSSSAAKVVRPNAATVLKPATEQDYLYELDKSTSDVIAAITAWTADHPGEGGGSVKVGEGSEAEVLEVDLPMNPPTLPQLQRLRRQFIALNRQHNLSKARVKTLFVTYLNDAFEN